MTEQRAKAFEHPTPDNSVLVLVDVQGKLAGLMHESDAMIRQQRLLIQACQQLNVPIVWAEQVPHKLGPTVDALAELLTNQKPIEKVSFGCCEQRDLMAAIDAHTPRHVLLAGIETHVCVWQTAASLLAKGFAVHAIEDAMSSRHSANKAVGLRRMQQAGACASSVEMVLFELMGSAEHPDFRVISGLIKQASS